MKLIAMIRGQQTAEVHPDEMENYRAGGWSVATTGDNPLAREGNASGKNSVKGSRAKK